MKKKVFGLISLIILVLISQVVLKIFITEREENYILDGYTIIEKLKVIENEEYYDFVVTDKSKNKYIFGIKGKFNKKKKIVEEIKSFKEGNLVCIYPVYKNDVIGDIACKYNDKQVSYAYLRQVENKSVLKFIDKLKREGINNPKWDDVSERKTVIKHDSKKIEVYQDNIPENYKFLIWRYKGLYLLNNDKSIAMDYLENDQYDNVHSALVGKYYITAETAGGKLKELVSFDISKLKKKKITFKNETSIKYYFNGVIEDKLYITDVGLRKQYIVDPKKGKIEELVATKDKFISYKDLKKIEVAPKELLAEEIYFTDSVTNKKLSNIYKNIVDIKMVRDYYYFRTSVGNVYRVDRNNLKEAELLFTFKNISDWIIKDDDIMIASEEMVYFYNEEVGLIPVAKNSELKYNYKNICDFWKA